MMSKKVQSGHERRLLLCLYRLADWLDFRVHSIENVIFHHWILFSNGFRIGGLP